MTSANYHWATIQVLWRRDLRRFWRQPSRLIGALGQPIIFWLVIGGGMNRTFHLPNQPMGYLEYFYPGVVLMVALFAAIFASVSVIDDRQQGFLQSVLAGPGSRVSLVMGKCLGSASVAMLQMLCFLLLAPLAGFAYSHIDWPTLLCLLFLATFSLSALSFGVAWFLNNMQAYHAIQMTFLVPMWVVSGAMFPWDHNASAFAWLMLYNPLAYAVSLVRHALYGGAAPLTTVLPLSWELQACVLLSFAALSFAFAAWACRRS